VLKNLVLTLLVTVLFPSTILTESKNKESKRLEASAKVLQEIMDTPHSAIPNDLLDRCERLSHPFNEEGRIKLWVVGMEKGSLVAERAAGTAGVLLP